METMQQTISMIEEKAKKMRMHALDMALVAGSNGAHLGPGYSMMEIMATLFFSVMKHDAQNPEWDERDRFVLSKGHGVLGYYTALAEAGYFDTAELRNFETNDSFLAGHPSMNMQYGLEVTSGSLGNGISLAAGIALAAKADHKKFSTYCYVGDGECNEGLVWEAAMSAAHFGLDNLTVIVDRNLLQSDGIGRDIMYLGDMAKKWESFGWETVEVDGHNVSQLLEALHYRSQPVNKPYAIIAHTVKGKGVSFFENNNKWHHGRLSQQQYDDAMAELQGGC